MDDRTLEVERWTGEPDTEVLVSIRSPRERDVSIPHDAQDLILMIARVMGWSVMIDKQGGAEEDLGVGGG